jgi:fructokinase
MRIGIDLGGTKIEIVVLDESGIIAYKHRVATPQGNYEDTLHSIVQLVREAEKQVGEICTVGIGTPGALSPATGLLRNSNSVCLNGKPFKQDLERLLGKTVRIENDANCFALSEAIDGAAKAADIVFGVIVGTGTGAGIVINKQVLTGRNAIAGEWGHNPLPWVKHDELPGEACYCGQNGCIETYLSGPGLMQQHHKRSGQYLTPKEMAEHAEYGDALCEESLQIYEHCMARSLAHIINIIDPDVIVLGGGLSNLSRLYTNVPQQWQNYVFSDVVKTRLVRPKYGDSSGVRGAAWLWN